MSQGLTRLNYRNELFEIEFIESNYLPDVCRI